MKIQDEVIMVERRRLSFFGLPWTFTKYYITPKKLIVESGFLSSTEDEVLMYRITDISYSMSFIQKLFGLGTITIYSHDKSNPTLLLKNIKNSREFKDKLSKVIEKDRQRMSMRQTEVLDFDNDANFYY